MKRFKRFLKGVLIVVLVLAVIHGIASMVLSRKVASKIAAIKAQGDPVSMAELGKVDIPDSENGATVYLQIFKEIGKPIVYKNGVPQTKPDETKNINYNEFAKDKKITSETWAKAEKTMAAYQHALDLVDEAASKPGCKFKTNWEDGPAALFPHYAALRELSRMLMIDARINAHNGNMDKAIKRTGQIFKVSEAISDDPIMICHLVRVAIVSIGLKNIRDIAQERSINASQAKNLDDILAQIDMDGSSENAMKGERAFGITSYSMFKGKGMHVLWESMHNDSSKIPLYVSMLSWIGRPFIYMDEAAYLDYMNKQVRDANLPYIERSFSKPGYNETSELPKYAILSKWMLPVFSSVLQRRDMAISEIRSGRAYLGAIVYKDRFGEYPKSLDDLQSRLGWKVEIDPLADKDFHYKRQGAGFLLYGVGQNLRDDNGVSYMNKSTYSSDFEHDDIVWEMKN
ncbi:MAG: hypothetical protein ACYC27_15895 [Armatimonadota bacterium]